MRDYGLRKTVALKGTKTGLKLSHPSWDLEIETPVDFPIENPQDIDALKSLPEVGQGLSDFLFGQSLFDFSILKQDASVDGESITRICQACANEWYGVLYSHRWWEQLAHSVSEAGLKKWIIQNHALSRIAAKSSAQAILSGSVCSDFFLQSIVEEFDHHKRYFKRENAKIGLTVGDYDQSPPLGITGLSHYVSWLAANDQLGLIVFYFFQESSAHMAQDFRSYYDHLETLYGIEGFFNGWMAHVNEDFDLEHGDQVEEALLSFEEVSPDKLEQSLIRAWMCVLLLIADYETLSRNAEGRNRSKLRPEIPSSTLVRSALLGLASFDDEKSIGTFGGALTRLASVEPETASSLSPWDAEIQRVLELIGGNDAKLFALMLGEYSTLHDADEQKMDELSILVSTLSLGAPPDLLAGGRYGLYA